MFRGTKNNPKKMGLHYYTHGKTEANLTVQYSPKVTIASDGIPTLDPPVDHVRQIWLQERHRQNIEELKLYFKVWKKDNGTSYMTDNLNKLFTMLVEDLPACLPRLKKLDVGEERYSRATILHAKSIQVILDSATSLEHLRLFNWEVCGLQNDYDNLAASAGANKTLRCLTVHSATEFHGVTNTGPKSVLTCLSNLQGLVELTLSNLSRGDAVLPVQTLIGNNSHCLESLELEFAFWESNQVQDLMEGLKVLPLLKELSLVRKDSWDKNMATAIKRFVDAQPASLKSLRFVSGYHEFPLRVKKLLASTLKRQSSMEKFVMRTFFVGPDTTILDETILKELADMARASSHLYELFCPGLYELFCPGLMFYNLRRGVDSAADPNLDRHRAAIQFYILRNRIRKDLYDTTISKERQFQLWAKALSLETLEVGRLIYSEKLKVSLVYSAIRKDPAFLVRFASFPPKRHRRSERLSKKRQRESASSHGNGDNPLELSTRRTRAKKSRQPATL